MFGEEEKLLDGRMKFLKELEIAIDSVGLFVSWLKMVRVVGFRKYEKIPGFGNYCS